jgi:anti-sigma B factor antagonist
MNESRAFGAVIDLDTATLYLRGEFDMEGAPAFDDALRLLLLADLPTLVVDLADVTFMGSTGLACLIRAGRHHPKVVLRSPQPSVRRVLEVTQLDQAFEVVEAVSG